MSSYDQTLSLETNIENYLQRMPTPEAGWSHSFINILAWIRGDSARFESVKRWAKEHSSPSHKQIYSESPKLFAEAVLDLIKERGLT